MQFFSANATMFLKEMSKKILKRPQKLLIIGPIFFFQYCQHAQNQPKSHILLQKMAPCATSI